MIISLEIINLSLLVLPLGIIIAGKVAVYVWLTFIVCMLVTAYVSAWVFITYIYVYDILNWRPSMYFHPRCDEESMMSPCFIGILLAITLPLWIIPAGIYYLYKKYEVNDNNSGMRYVDESFIH
jgi:hypothetical protein